MRSSLDEVTVQSVQELRTKLQEDACEDQPHSGWSVTRSDYGSGFLFA
ncbi:hypothetical protein MHH93_22165 [Priestia sp. FSL H7-0729]